MAKKNLSKPQSEATPKTEETAEVNATGKDAPVFVRDAWNYSYDLVKGLDNIFYAITCSDAGLTPDGATALGVLSGELLEHMARVNGYFDPKAEE